MTPLPDLAVVPVMAIARADVADAAVQMPAVVPTHEAARPRSCGLEIGEALGVRSINPRCSRIACGEPVLVHRRMEKDSRIARRTRAWGFARPNSRNADRA